MAIKIKIFSQAILGIASAITLSYATTISPAHACEGDPTGLTNCSETTECKLIYDDEGHVVGRENCGSDEEDILIAPAPISEADTYLNADVKLDSERDVSHSFFLAGNEVTSKDRVNGVHFIAGNLVDFTGSTEYGAFVGNSIKINGEVEKDLFVAGNSIEIGEDTNIGRDFYATATTILVKTNLNNNVFISGSRVVLENVTIAGDLNLSASEIIVKGKVSIAGTLKYNNGAVITGTENLFAEETEMYAGSSSKLDFSFTTSITTKIIFLIGRLLVTIIVIAIASKFSKRLLSEFSLKNSWKDLALGLGLILALPLAIIFTTITIIGLPLALVGFGFYVLFIYLATSVTGLVVGDQLAKHIFKNEKLHIFLKAAMGIVLIVLLGLIPFVGGLITAVSTCFGFGYIVHKIFRQPKATK